MNERNLVICDRDIRYADSLGENISAHTELAVKVYVCSSLESIAKLAEKKTLHLFVVDEIFPYAERMQIQAEQVFVLGRGKVTDLGEGESQIGKYQCADHIIREIFETYIDKTKENIMRYGRKGRASFIAVYSPIHRLGKTRFAMALGKECAKTKRVLYLNFEEYAGLSDKEQMTLSDLLYYMKQNNGNLSIRLQTTVRQMDGMDYLMPIPISQDLKEVTVNEWKLLLGQIAENSDYELVILDMSESVQGLWEILEGCERIYMPVLEDEISRSKLEQYDENIKQLHLERLEHLTHRFVMPEDVETYAEIRAKEEFV